MKHQVSTQLFHKMMIFVNEAYKADAVYKPYAEGIVKMLSCITPHIGEEMWQLLGHEDTNLRMSLGQHMMKLNQWKIQSLVLFRSMVKVRGKFEAAVGSSK